MIPQGFQLISIFGRGLSDLMKDSTSIMRAKKRIPDRTILGNRYEPRLKLSVSIKPRIVKTMSTILVIWSIRRMTNWPFHVGGWHPKEWDANPG